MSVTGFNTCIYLALQSTTAVNAVLVNATTPVLILMVSALVAGRVPAPLETVGVALSLGGLVWIVFRGDISLLLQVKFSRGDLWTLAAAFFWALYTVGLKRRPPQLEPLVFLTALIAIGVVCLAPPVCLGACRRCRPAADATCAAEHFVCGGFPLTCWPTCSGTGPWGKVGANKAGVFMYL